MKPQRIWFNSSHIFLQMDDGQEASLPLKTFPSLYNATKEELNNYTLSPMGIHWEQFDEDLSFAGFFDKQSDNNDIAHLFSAFPELNINQFAKVIGINQSLMAKYICGVSKPSEVRKKQIIDAMHRLSKELGAVQLRSK